MTPCQRLKHLMFDFAEGELDEKDRAAIQEHLDACADCNRFVEQIRALRMRLGRLKPVQTSDDFILRLRSRIRQESAGPVPSGSLFWDHRRWIPALGLGILFLASGFLLLDQTRYSPRSPLADKPAEEPASVGTNGAQPVRLAAQSNEAQESQKLSEQSEEKTVAKNDSSESQDKLNEQVRSRIRAVNY
jgi:anti-sigma factor RsiW